MNINLDKRDASILNNEAELFVQVNAPKGTPFSQENAKVEYKLKVIFDGNSTKVKHLWLTEKNPINAYDK